MRERTTVLSCALAMLATFAGSPASADLISVEWNTGDFYSISTTNGALTYLANPGIVNVADIMFAPNGKLYAITAGAPSAAKLYEVDLVNETATPIGTGLGNQFVYEGALAFGNDGIAYGLNYVDATQPHLFTIDLATGLATDKGVITDPVNDPTRLFDHDINGMVRRSDGKFVALDAAWHEASPTSAAVPPRLLLLDPVAGTFSTLKEFPVGFLVGGVGGVSQEGGYGYFVTAGPHAGADTDPGSSLLYRFDLYTGNYEEVGSYAGPLDPETTYGLSALAAPEPATAGLLALGALLLRRRSRGS